MVGHRVYDKLWKRKNERKNQNKYLLFFLCIYHRNGSIFQMVHHYLCHTALQDTVSNLFCFPHICHSRMVQRKQHGYINGKIGRFFANIRKIPLIQRAFVSFTHFIASRLYQLLHRKIKWIFSVALEHSIAHIARTDETRRTYSAFSSSQTGGKFNLSTKKQRLNAIDCVVGIIFCFYNVYNCKKCFALYTFFSVSLHPYQNYVTV